MALRKIRCGASKCRCGDKEIYVLEVIRLIYRSKRNCLPSVEIMLVYTIVSNSSNSGVALWILGVALTVGEKGVELLVG